MRYLFFDVECALVKKNSSNIFSLGYVFTNKNFEVSINEDLLINPNVKKWDKFVERHILSYKKSELENSPTFEGSYSTIKSLLEKSNQIIFGFSVDNDINYLNLDCLRYSLPKLNFNCVEVRDLIKKVDKRRPKSLFYEYVYYHCEDRYAVELLKYVPRENLFDLSKGLYKYLLNGDEMPHKSSYDAYMTYSIVNKLIEKHGYNKVITVINSIVKNSSDFEDKAEMILPGDENRVIKGYKNYFDYKNFIKKLKVKNDVEKVLLNKHICISNKYAHENYKEILFLMQAYTDCGGVRCEKASESNIFVYDEECDMLKYAIESKENGNDIEIMKLDEFLDLLNIDKEYFSNL